MYDLCKIYEKAKVSLMTLTPLKVHPLKMAQNEGKKSTLSTAHR